MSYLSLKRAHFTCLVISLALVWATGIIWLGLRIANGSPLFEGGFASAGQLLLMKAHSFVAYCLLLCLGSLMFHIREGLKGRKNKRSGMIILGCFATLIVSGWGLYYFGDDSYRWSASLIHSIAGSIVAFVFLAHWRKFSLSR